MKQLIWISALFAAWQETSACSIIDASYRIDTVSSGTVQIVETTYQPIPPTTVGSRIIATHTQAQMDAYLFAALRDSALVFMARIDSVLEDTSISVSPLVRLEPGTGPRARIRLQVDTLLRGSLPGPTFWIETAAPGGMCGSDWGAYAGKIFLNASSSLEKDRDLKLSSSGYFGYRYAAHWFDGRYLVAPPYPGLRLDITRILSDYPATGITPRRLSPSPLRPTGKAWLPNGRAAGSRDAREHPVPILK